MLSQKQRINNIVFAIYLVLSGICSWKFKDIYGWRELLLCSVKFLSYVPRIVRNGFADFICALGMLFSLEIKKYMYLYVCICFYTCMCIHCYFQYVGEVLLRRLKDVHKFALAEYYAVLCSDLFFTCDHFSQKLPK